MSRDLLLEIGCEELPAGFVEAALAALPRLVERAMSDLRLEHGDIDVYGTPRRLAVLVHAVSEAQPDLDEEVVGPPVNAAYKDGVPTRAAEAFAQKLGVGIDELRRVETPKGVYLAGTRREKGRPAQDLLPGALQALVPAVSFRKSMRWGRGDWGADPWGHGRWDDTHGGEPGATEERTFGRPVRWLCALFGDDVVQFDVTGLRSGRQTRGHRFLAPAPVAIARPSEYLAVLRNVHVIADPAERARLMHERLAEAAAAEGGELVADDFLMRENLHLVEDPAVVAGGFDEAFLTLPERVIVAVAKGHQRWFCVARREPSAGSGQLGAKALMPRYLAVVGTAERPDLVRRGMDRVMRARLADARFFFEEDLKRPLADRKEALGGIVFHHRLGTVLAKVERVTTLVAELGKLTSLPEAAMATAAAGAQLCKCDLTTLMVGEFPELQGEMGMAYAKRQGVAAPIAEVICDHYLPKGAGDATPAGDAAALVALADRLDTLVGCFAIGLAPSGAADPFALRRAAIGSLRIVLDRGFGLSLVAAVRAAYDLHRSVSLDLGEGELEAKLGAFLRDRLRGILGESLPGDAVDAALGVADDRPVDARERARALDALDAATRVRLGEVFKRATNIAKQAPPGEPELPPGELHASERALFEGFASLRGELSELVRSRSYAAAFGRVAAFAPLLDRYFVDVFVMADEPVVRDCRLRLMRAISETVGALARLELLAPGG